MSKPAAPKPAVPLVSKPRKRPAQLRAKFTVTAVYDAFVRIWRVRGWAGVTTRAVALETGISVGTLYEYFPNKHALLSGYVRHTIDLLLDAIEREVVRPPDLPWRERVHRLVTLSCGADPRNSAYFDREMLMLTREIAEPKHDARVYDELSAKWVEAINACTDLPHPPETEAVISLFVSVWGGRRYLLLVGAGKLEAQAWAAQMERVCGAALGGSAE